MTKKTSKYIRDCGYELVEMWECEWDQYKRDHITENRYTYPTEWKFRMTESELLEHVQKNEIFGAVEIDIHVPPQMKEYFQEMPPIFKNCFVSFDDIGDHMREYLQETNQSFKGRNYLIGSMFANNILIITPLLNWYIEKGLKVTRVHQLIEFKPAKCFEGFVDQVTNDRRMGDVDPSLKARADTSKLIGNCFYGHTIQAKSRHLSIEFCKQDIATVLVNNPRFKSLEEHDNGCYEVPRLINLNINHSIIV